MTNQPNTEATHALYDDFLKARAVMIKRFMEEKRSFEEILYSLTLVPVQLESLMRYVERGWI